MINFNIYEIYLFWHFVETQLLRFILIDIMHYLIIIRYINSK